MKKLDSIALQDVPERAPGIATAIISNGRVVYQKFGGIADLSDSVPITAKSRFNMASNGKQFTALAVLLLEKEGRLHLNDDIRKYLPSLFPLVKDNITIAHLLTHTSGIRDVYDLWSMMGKTWWKQTYSNRDALELLQRQTELNFRPGEYLYSNSNYILLALIIEKASGQSFKNYTDQMFRKLKMMNTAFECDYKSITGPVARAYFNFGSWTTYNWIWNICGDGNLFSTLQDQVKWECYVQTPAKAGKYADVLRNSQQLVDHALNKNYGFGLEFGTYKNYEYTFHEGATGAWKATVIRFPAKKLSMLTLTNTGKAIPSSQTRQMADLVLELNSKTPTYAVTPSKESEPVRDEDILGTYLTGNTFYFRFLKKDGELLLRRDGRNDTRLVREGANIFHQWNDPAFKQEFVRNEKGEMTVTAYYTTHAPYTLTRPLANWNGFLFSSISGKYINTETGAVLLLEYNNDSSYRALLGGTNNYAAVPVTPAKLLLGGYLIDISDSKPATLFLSGDRVRKVRFERMDE